MNIKKAALLLVATALCSASAFATAVPVAAPVFTPNASPVTGTTVATYIYADGLGVAIAPGTLVTGEHCYYTTNGTTPISATGTVAAGAASCDAGVTVTVETNTYGEAVTTTIKAINWLPATTLVKESATTSVAYKVENIVSAPIITPNGSPSTAPVNVQITDKFVGKSGTTGATSVLPTIYYTTDGTTPTNLSTKYVPTGTGKTVIELPLTTAGSVLKAIAYATGFLPSSVASAGFGETTPSTAAVVIASGSSAQAAEYALAMGGVKGNGDGACGNVAFGGHHFTKSNAAYASDVRSGVTPADLGNLVIVWDNSNDTTDPNVTNTTLYPTPGAPGKVCVYLQLDSTLGVKAFMNSNLVDPAESFNFNIVADHNYGAGNAISPFWVAGGTDVVVDENMIPSDVFAIVQGQPFNVGVTDIRPEDAYFATQRALGVVVAARTGLGYGPGPVGKPINAISGSQFNVAAFAIHGQTDPITGKAQQPYVTVPIGAAPVMVIVNTTVPSTTDSAFHFSNSEVKNIGRFTLAGYLNGSITSTAALATTTGVTDAPVHVWLREPLSGTYNTMEFNIPRSAELINTAISQENGITPKVVGTCLMTGAGINAPISTPNSFFAGCTGGDANHNSGNPLWIKVSPAAILTNALGTVNASGVMIGVNNATRARAIGTGEMVKQVALNVTPVCTTSGTTTTCIPTAAAGSGAYANGYNDALGYTFWGYGNIKSGNNHADTNTKYLTVDGVDPIFATYTTGLVPTCTTTSYNDTTGCPVALTFPNIENGTYPIWSVYRAVIPATGSTLASANGGNNLTLINSVITAAETAATTVQDFAPLTNMQVFRSHYSQAGVAPVNNSATSTPGVAGGTISSATEAGGDVGGAVFTFQANLDHLAQYGTEIVGVKQ